MGANVAGTRLRHQTDECVPFFSSAVDDTGAVDGTSAADNTGAADDCQTTRSKVYLRHLQNAVIKFLLANC